MHPSDARNARYGHGLRAAGPGTGPASAGGSPPTRAFDERSRNAGSAYRGWSKTSCRGVAPYISWRFFPTDALRSVGHDRAALKSPDLERPERGTQRRNHRTNDRRFGWHHGQREHLLRLWRCFVCDRPEQEECSSIAERLRQVGRACAKGQGGKAFSDRAARGHRG